VPVPVLCVYTEQRGVNLFWTFLPEFQTNVMCVQHMVWSEREIGRHADGQEALQCPQVVRHRHAHGRQRAGRPARRAERAVPRTLPRPSPVEVRFSSAKVFRPVFNRILVEVRRTSVAEVSSIGLAKIKSLVLLLPCSAAL
jgi:hypothetical protein